MVLLRLLIVDGVDLSTVLRSWNGMHWHRSPSLLGVKEGVEYDLPFSDSLPSDFRRMISVLPSGGLSTHSILPIWPRP